MANNRFQPSNGRRDAKGRLPHDLGRRMVREHSAFLSAALDEHGRVRPGVREPRIPSMRADKGGFAKLLALPGARAAVAHWWKRVLG